VREREVGVTQVIRKLRGSDMPATAQLLARAFADNAAYGFIHPRAATRSRDLRAFFTRNLHWHLALDLTSVICDASDRPLGTATLEPPGGVPATQWQSARHWLLPTLLAQGPRVLGRMRIAGAAFARLNRASAGGDAYWHVHAVAVDPSAQRSGAGSALLRHVFGELEALLAVRPAPVVLQTQLESNVRLYQRFGFEVVSRDIVGSGEPDAFATWSMRRAA
jgi:ribosomal protein S18 acetylase RimI-like enzyme